MHGVWLTTALLGVRFAASAQDQIDVCNFTSCADDSISDMRLLQASLHRSSDKGIGRYLKAKQECKWHRTGICSRTGPQQTSDPGDRSCSQTVPLSEVGFCDCDGDGVKKKTELQFDCSSTPGKCSNLCQPRKIQIPRQIILTSAVSKITGLAPHLLNNVGKISSLNDQLQIRYFGDQECTQYLKDYFADSGLVQLFEGEAKGAFRGDICRGAILYREGGFYTDVDLEVATPFLSMVDENTHFMTAFDSGGLLYNALMATTPFSPVMGAYLREMQEFYKKGFPDQDNMGPYVLNEAMKSVMAEHCPEVHLEDKLAGIGELQWACGNESYRIYKEAVANCEFPDECAPERRDVAGLRRGVDYGLFDWSEAGPTRSLVGWSRVVNCTDWMCGSNSLMQLVQDDASGIKLRKVTPLRLARLNHTLKW